MKALLILFVVMGHIKGCVLTPFLYLFHVPAFFFVSGYLQSLANNYRGGKKEIRSIKFLILAIAFWNFFFLCLSNGSEMLFTIFRNEDISLELHKTLKSILGIFCCWNKEFMPKIVPFWFIWVLIIIKVIYCFINRFECKIKVLIVCLCIIYCILANLIHKSLPFLLDRTIIALPFYISGNIFRVKNLVAKIFAFPRSFKILFCISGFVCLLFTLKITGSYDMFSMYQYIKGRSVLWYYVVSFIGTFILILCCEKLPRNKFVEIVSEGTLLILALHMSLIKIINKVGVFNIDFSQVSKGLAICVLCIPLILLSKKYFPYSLGKKRK